MTFPTAAAMTTRRRSLVERLGAVIAPPSSVWLKPAVSVPRRSGRLLVVGSYGSPHPRVAPAPQQRHVLATFSYLSLHDRQSVRHGAREDVGVQQHDHADDRTQHDRMPEHPPENRALIAHLISRRRRHGD